MRPTLTLLLLAAGCGGSADTVAVHDVSGPGVISSGRVRWELPIDWLERSSIDFERLLPEGPVEASSESLERLSQGLAGSPAEATRAALLLARIGTPEARELLVARLERRIEGPEREADAGDCTAARALAGFAFDAGTSARLRELVAGPHPHPDLEVRTECAAALLCLGEEAGVPWLLAVLRIDTPEAERRGERITESDTTAWPRGRAAEVLCAYLGLEHRVWTDAPLEERAARALELEAAFEAR